MQAWSGAWAVHGIAVAGVGGARAGARLATTTTRRTSLNPTMLGWFSMRWLQISRSTLRSTCPSQRAGTLGMGRRGALSLLPPQCAAGSGAHAHCRAAGPPPACERTLSPLSMNLMATSSPVPMSRMSLATPKLPLPRSLTSWYRSMSCARRPRRPQARGRRAAPPPSLLAAEGYSSGGRRRRDSSHSWVPRPDPWVRDADGERGRGCGRGGTTLTTSGIGGGWWRGGGPARCRGA